MSFNAGDIVIELSLDNKNFQLQVKNSGALMRQLQGTFDNTAKSVKRLEEVHDSLGRKFRDVVLTLGNLRFVAMDVHDVFLRLPTAIIKSAGELERVQALLSGLSKEMTKSARDAEGAANFQFITEMAKRAPFDIQALSDSFVKLKSAGLDPTKGSLQTLVDSVARFGGSSDTFKRASVAIQQMLGKGVVSMEELRQQLGEAVPTAMRDMATGMGLSMAELTKLVSKGTVEAGDAINKMFVVMNLRNKGAAAELMNTWTGTLSNLQTRWALATKEIADAGFMDSVKQVATQLGNALESIQFKRFALDFGRGLAAGVDSIAAIIRTLMEYADAIKSVGTAWLLYKGTTAFVAPALKGIVSGVQGVSAAYASQVNALNQAAAAQKAAAIAAVQAQQQQTAAEMVERQKRIAWLEAEMAYRRAEAADILRVNNQTREALAQSFRAGTAVRDPSGSGRFISRQAAADQINEIDRVNRANQAAMRQIQADLDLAAAAQKRATLQAGEHAVALNKVQGAASTGSRAMAALGTAASAVGTAFNALGGWATVLNLAITAGIYLWFNWGKAAEEAAARAERARKGLSDQKDVEATTKALNEARQRRADALQQLAVAETQGWDRATDRRKQQYEALKALVVREEATITKLSAEAFDHRKNVETNNARDEAANFVRLAEAQITQINGDAAKKLAAIDKTVEDEVKAADGNKAKLEATYKKQGDAVRNIAIERARSTVNAIKSALNELGAKMNGPEAAAATQAATTLRGQLAAAESELANALNSLGKNKLIEKDDKAVRTPVQNKIDTFINNLQEEAAKLKAGLPGIYSTLGRADAAAQAIAEVMAKFESGDFTEQVKSKDGKSYVKVQPSKEKLELAKRMAADAATLRDLYDSSKDISSKLLQLGPDYARALDVLADPLYGNADGKRTNQFDEFVAKLKAAPAQLEQIAQQLGVSSRAIIEKFEKGGQQAATIDYAQFYRSFAEENRALGVEIITNDAARAREQIAIDDKLFQARVNNLRAYAVAAKLNADQEAQLEQTISEATARRITANALKLRTPLERLVDSWKDTTQQMDQATATWAQNSIDAFINTAATGKQQFGSLVKQIILDLAKIELQKTLGGTLSTLLKGVADAYLGGGSGFTKGYNPDYSNEGRNYPNYTVVPNANGGVMSQFGSMPLRRYAAGGIQKARHPALAMYGEGDMNEAFVPLPDGRRIPVALSGGGQAEAPSVHFNIINQTGSPVSAKQQGQPRFDGKRMVLDVVLEGMSSPGAFRDSMKNLMSN